MSQLESVDVQQLRWFVAVAEELHFARAAKALNIARQKLSNTVIEMEAELGYRLFVPGAAPTQLSDAGHEALVEAREIIARDDAEQQAARAEELALAIANAERVLRIGFVPGVTVSKWSRIWSQRFPDVPLDIVAIRADEQESALRDGRVDMAFVRMPIDREGLNAIPLYQEVPVVLAPKEHLLAAFDDVSVADLADENLHESLDLDSVRDTVELVAAGVGLVIVPHSLARLHARKDLIYRTVTDAPHTEVILAWPAQRTTDLVEEFIGVVRGRSERSTRTPTRAEPSKKAPAKRPTATKQAKGAAKPRTHAAKKPAKRRGR